MEQSFVAFIADGIRCGSNFNNYHSRIANLPSYESFGDDDDAEEVRNQPPVRGFRGHLPRDVCHVTTTATRKLLAERVYLDQTARPIEQRDLRLINSVRNPLDEGASKSAQATENGHLMPTASSINFSCKNIFPQAGSGELRDNSEKPQLTSAMTNAENMKQSFRVSVLWDFC